MRANFLFILISIALLCSCSEQTTEFTVSDQKLKDLLKDLHLAEEVTSRFRDYDKDSVRAVYWADISKAHQLDTSEINFNLRILKNNPEKAFKLYEEMYNEMNQEYLQRENKVNKPDSKK